MSDPSWTTGIHQVLDRISQEIQLYLPNLIGAFVLVLIGWLLATLLGLFSRGLVQKLLQVFARASAIQSVLHKTQAHQTIPKVVGRLVYWLVLLFFIAAGVETLGLPVVTGLLNRTATYLPHVLAAFLILFAGILIGNFVRDAINHTATTAKLAFGPLLAQIAYLGILCLAIIVAIDQLGIDATFINVIATTIIATTFGATALAFGLGARQTVSNIIASHYVQKNYQIGQRIKIGPHEGRLAQIDTTSVLLETEQGRLTIPAHTFNQEPSLLVQG